MILHFTKMHGLGNDFMVVDAIRQKIYFSHELIKRLADRHFGIGFDQLLVVEPPYDPDLDFHYRIFNADGSEVQMCGNGARCFVKFVVEHGLCNKSEINVSTMSGVLTLKLNEDNTVTVNMGKPKFAPESLPFVATQEELYYDIEVNGQTIPCSIVSMGNPHVVLNVEDIDTADVENLGPALESHSRFPERVNVGFSQVIDNNTIALRVFERGCGETFACGTGACAAAVANIRQGRVTSPVKVKLKGGDLNIAWNGSCDDSVLMSGPAVSVFEGTIEI